MQLDDDAVFQDRQWKVQRVAWVFLAMVPLAALTGAFGHGALSTRRDATGAMSVTYERFARRASPTTMRIRVASSVAERAALRIRFDRRYLEAMHTTHFLPAPTRMRAAGDVIEMEFDARFGADANNISIELRPSRWGSIRGELGLVNAAPIAFQQFVWP